jgi:hypothetical protein
MRRIYRHLVPIRVPLVIVIAATILTLRVPQIQELFSVSVAMLGNDVDSMARTPRAEQAWMLASATLLALSVWYSARTLLRFDVVRSDTAPFGHANAAYREWAPRILATSVTLVVAVGFIGARGDAGTRLQCALVVLAGGLVVGLFSWVRRDVFELVRPGSMKRAKDETYPIAEWRCHVEWKVWWSVIAAYVAVVFVSCTSQACMTEVAGIFGPLSTLMVLAAFFVGATTPLVLWASYRRAPVFLLLLLWAIGWQKAGYVDNHAITTTAAGVQLSEITQRIDTWLTNTECRTAYLVSAEGGGIRAAAWTALVLARLDRELRASGKPPLADCLVGASGVSGGSLGLAAFVAGGQVVRAHLGSGNDESNCAKQKQEEREDEGELECRLIYMLTRDFMSPTLAAMFTSDQAQRLIPKLPLPDRGKALESAFSRAFSTAFRMRLDDRANPFGEAFAFSRLYPDSGRDWTPILLLNTTDVRTGARIIQSGVSFLKDEHGAEKTGRFPAAEDLRDWLLPTNEEVTLLGAVHNSARFPYISPAGTVKSKPKRQLVDGGYFENSGATTLLDLLRLFRDRKSVNARPWEGAIIAVHISNDPALVRGDRAQPAVSIEAASVNDKHEAAYGEIMPPPLTLLNTRDARGEYARRMLQRSIEEMNSKTSEKPRDEFVWQPLTERAGGYPLPLGWRIGDLAICEMIVQYDQATNRSLRRENGIPVPAAPLQPVPSEHCPTKHVAALQH